jgi:hypothetical protein
MLTTLWAVVKNEKIELLENLNIPEGTKVIVTLLDDKDDEKHFWEKVSEISLDTIWNNTEDDIYAELLER